LSKLLARPAPLFYENALYRQVNATKSLIYMYKIVHGVRRPRRERTAAWLIGAAGIYLTDFSVSHSWEKYNQLTLLNWSNEGKKSQQFQGDRRIVISRAERGCHNFCTFHGRKWTRNNSGALSLTKPPLTHNPPGIAPLASPAPTGEP